MFFIESMTKSDIKSKCEMKRGLIKEKLIMIIGEIYILTETFVDDLYNELQIWILIYRGKIQWI